MSVDGKEHCLENRYKELFEEINNDPSEIHRPYGFR